MRYYHLSPDASLKWILPASTGETEGVATPRIPKLAHYEDQTIPRVCVAPEVWLCVLAGIVVLGRLYIYTIDVPQVTEPVPGPDGGMVDYVNTGEKWITDDDIAACGGRMEISRIGFVDFDQILDWKLRKFVGCLVLPSATTDDAVWRIVGSQWVLREEVAYT